jgi:purine-binding chemotaxis protein CheW
MTVDAAEEAREIGVRLSGKYMTFRLSSEEYGLPILKVKELVALAAITRVPGAAEFMRGVINLRGKILPVLDLREKFGMGQIAQNKQTVVIVVEHLVDGRLRSIGIMVDEALEVIRIDPASIEALPDAGPKAFQSDLILGVAKAKDRVVFLLDIDLALAREGSAPAMSPSPPPG